MSSAPPTSHDPDAALTAAARAGDSGAVDQLIERHQGAIYRLARRMVNNPADAEEVLQETFLKMIESIASFRGESSFRTWLYKLAVNEALMLRRRRRRHPEESLELHLPEFDQRGMLAQLEAQFGAIAQADETLERRELLDLARSAIERLPEESRAVLVLRDLESLSSEQTAQALGISDAAVRQRLHRARLMLRQEFDQLLGGGHARTK